jgi:hypothetical protein
MRWLALEAGDAATWGSTVVTFGMACYAVAQGISQRRDLRRQNELQAEASQLQRRQSETAERRTLVMEQLLTQLTAESRPPAPPPVWPSPAPPAQRQTAPVPPPAPAADLPDEVADEDEEASEPVRSAGPAGPPGGYGYPRGDGSPPQPQPATYEPPPYQPPGVSAPPSYQQPGPAYEARREDVPWSPPAPMQQQPAWSSMPANPWRIERIGRNGFALRNTGTSTLTDVHVSRAELPASARGVPENGVVRPGETAEFLMAAGRGDPLPGTILVSWDGQPHPVPVPVPQG